MRRFPLFHRRADQGPATRSRHVQPVATRQNLAGAAARWVIRQGVVSLGLHVGGFAALAVAAFLLAAPLGWAVIGVSLLVLETLTRSEHP